MNDLFLIYINFVGETHDGENIYEFIFSDDVSDVDGDEWDVYPAANRPEPPAREFVDEVMYLRSELKFDLIQSSNIFSYWDAIDGIIAIAWENIDTYEAYEENRLFFKYGDDKNTVMDKLYVRDLKLKGKLV